MSQCMQRYFMINYVIIITGSRKFLFLSQISATSGKRADNQINILINSEFHDF